MVSEVGYRDYKIALLMTSICNRYNVSVNIAVYDIITPSHFLQIQCIVITVHNSSIQFFVHLSVGIFSLFQLVNPHSVSS